MHQTLIKKISICFTSILLLFTCVSCKADTPYLVKDYLNTLALSSGIGTSDNLDDNYKALLKWKIVEDKDHIYFDNELKYCYLAKTIGRLIDSKDISINCLINNNLVDYKLTETDLVSKEKAEEIINKAVLLINNKEFDNKCEYSLNDNVKNDIDDLNNNDIFYDEENNVYKVVVDKTNNIYRDASFEEVFSYLDLSGTYEIDFSNAQITPYGQEETSMYQNNMYELLASKAHVFNSEGFRISYSINSSGISAHISKEIDGITIYGDIALNNIKPTFNWTYKDGDLSNCYFKINMNSTEKIGATCGRYGNYYLKFKDLDPSSFEGLLHSLVSPKKDQVEASIPLCHIKTPIPGVPTAYINLDLLVKLYVSGRVELALYNKHNIGFETRQGNIRFINDNDHNFDSIMSASAKAALGVNASIDAATFRLFDIELDNGIKAEVKTTMHLYDKDGNVESKTSDIAYGTLQDISKDNENVRVCGDVSLYWLSDLIINTSKSVMYKLGFTKTFHLSDEDNQVFNNLHHIENGHFVEKCTRNNRVVLNEMETVSSNKISLNSYAEVISINETYQIVINGLPDSYNESDICYSSLDSKIASVKAGLVTGVSAGSVKIKVYTKDNKYNAYVNILVSTG